MEESMVEEKKQRAATSIMGSSTASTSSPQTGATLPTNNEKDNAKGADTSSDKIKDVIDAIDRKAGIQADLSTNGPSMPGVPVEQPLHENPKKSEPDVSLTTHSTGADVSTKMTTGNLYKGQKPKVAGNHEGSSRSTAGTAGAVRDAAKATNRNAAEATAISTTKATTTMGISTSSTNQDPSRRAVRHSSRST